LSPLSFVFHHFIASADPSLSLSLKFIHRPKPVVFFHFPSPPTNFVRSAAVPPMSAAAASPKDVKAAAAFGNASTTRSRAYYAYRFVVCRQKNQLNC
jgi:hypothetical protein